MKKAKKERKYTLSGQMTAIFIGLLVFILMTVFIVIQGSLDDIICLISRRSD